MTKLKLINPTDEELSRAVCEYVERAKWHRPTEQELASGSYYFYTPFYATSANAVLRLLEKCQHFDHNWNCVHKQHWVWVKIEGYDKVIGSDPIFARAACIALLRANDIEVEITL